MPYARIQNGIVAEVFSPPAGVSMSGLFNPAIVWVECGGTPGIVVGWTYDGTAFHLPVSVPAAPNTQMLPLAFLARFTSGETAAISAAALSNPALLMWLVQASAASFIDLADPRTAAGLDALVAAGLLTQGRRNAVLTP